MGVSGQDTNEENISGWLRACGYLFPILLDILQTQSAPEMAGIHLRDNSGRGTENAQADSIRKMILNGSRGPNGAGHTLRTQQGNCLSLPLPHPLSHLPLLILLSLFERRSHESLSVV